MHFYLDSNADCVALRVVKAQPLTIAQDHSIEKI